MLGRVLHKASRCLGAIANKAVESDLRIGASVLVRPAGGNGVSRGLLPVLGKAARVVRSVLVGVTLLLACVTAALLLSNSGDAGLPEMTALKPTPALKPAWLPILRPIRLFALEAPELTKAAASYQAIRSTLGDGREDDLTFGSAAGTEAPFVRIAVYRSGSEASEPAPLAADLAQRAAAAGLVAGKAAPGEPIHSKFGEMQIVEVKLSQTELERSCLAFRRAVAGEALRIAGWYCAPVDGFAGRAGVSCLIDRLALISAGEDLALRDGFVAAERRRVSCGKIPMLAASIASPPVAEGREPPRLRGIKLR
jgi:hypothetical protein